MFVPDPTPWHLVAQYEVQPSGCRSEDANCLQYKGQGPKGEIVQINITRCISDCRYQEQNVTSCVVMSGDHHDMSMTALPFFPGSIFKVETKHQLACRTKPVHKVPKDSFSLGQFGASLQQLAGYQQSLATSHDHQCALH